MLSNYATFQHLEEHNLEIPLFVNDFQAENEYLRAENAVLKKLRELRLRDEKEQEEKRKLFKDW